VDDARVRQVAVFVFLYLAAYLPGALLLCACGFSLSDSLFEIASAIGTVRLSNENLYIGHKAAMDLVPYQLDPAIQALQQSRQRILIADAGVLMEERSMMT
jgi:hypothetical protein